MILSLSALLHWLFTIFSSHWLTPLNFWFGVYLAHEIDKLIRIISIQSIVVAFSSSHRKLASEVEFVNLLHDSYALFALKFHFLLFFPHSKLCKQKFELNFKNFSFCLAWNDFIVWSYFTIYKTAFIWTKLGFLKQV